MDFVTRSFQFYWQLGLSGLYVVLSFPSTPRVTAGNMVSHVRVPTIFVCSVAQLTNIVTFAKCIFAFNLVKNKIAELVECVFQSL